MAGRGRGTGDRALLGARDARARAAIDGTARLGAPDLPAAVVDRPRLRRALDDAAACTVTQVVGPVGSGKTVGVAAWLAHRSADGVREPPAPWWTVTSGLTVPGLRLLLARRITERSDDDDEIAPTRVVVDRAERLGDECVRELAAVLDDGSPGLRLVLLTRRELPLRRLRPLLLGRLAVVPGDVLRLDDDEARALAEHHAPGSPPATADAILDAAAGWAAALVLAARAAARGTPMAEGDPAALAAETDVVGDDALADLDERERHVLLAVCHEDVVTRTTAARLSDDPGAPHVLDGLERAGLVVREREHAAGAVRIHPVLLRAARRRLAAGGPDADRARAALLRAARSDLGRGDTGAALRHTYDGAGPTGVGELVARHGLAALLQGDDGAAARVHAAVPDVAAVPDPARQALTADLLGAVAAWEGDLDAAERHLADAVALARTHGHRALLPDARARLAAVELLRGRPGAAADLAADALRPALSAAPLVARVLAAAVADAAHARLDPCGHAVGPPHPAPPGVDLLATYLAHVTAAQHAVVGGRPDQAGAALAVPPPLPALPHHLDVDLHVRRALVAAACDDTGTLAEAAARLAARGAEPDAALAAGLLAVCHDDPAAAVPHLRRAAGGDETSAVALTAAVTLARVLATRGEDVAARRLAAETLERGRHRRDGVPFVAWVGHLVPLHVLLDDALLAAAPRTPSSWARDVARSVRAHWRSAAPEPRADAVVWRPDLTSREHEVLAHLARGATYADVAAALHLSANTVKTHVRSLYAKLGASRRSQALATARGLDLV